MYRRDLIGRRLDQGVLMFPGGVLIPIINEGFRLNPAEPMTFDIREATGSRGHYIKEECINELRARFTKPNYFLDFEKKETIKEVIFNDPATIVIWSDNSKTVVKCQPGDTYSKEVGLAMCIAKKYLGNEFKREFKKWLPKKSIKDMRKELSESCIGKSCHSCPLYYGNYSCKFTTDTENNIKKMYRKVFGGKEV